MKSQLKTFPKTVKSAVQISQRKWLYMYLTVLKFSNLQYITGIWPWRHRWLSRWWTREIFWNHTRRVQKWTNCKWNTVMTLLYHYALWSVIIDQACLVIIIIIMSHHTSRRVGLPASWPTLSVSCNSFGDFPVLPPCFVLLFFLFWSRFQKFWILVKFCCLCVLCQSPLKQKYSAIMSLTNKLSTNWCFLVQQSWQSQVGGRPISPFQEPIRMDWRFTSSLPVTWSVIIERFHSHGQHLCKFMGAKEIVYKRRVQLPQDLFGTPT